MALRLASCASRRSPSVPYPNTHLIYLTISLLMTRTKKNSTNKENNNPTKPLDLHVVWTPEDDMILFEVLWQEKINNLIAAGRSLSGLLP